MVFEAVTSKSLTDLKYKVKQAFAKQKAENDQLGKMAQELEQAKQQMQQLQSELQKAQKTNQELEQAKLKLEENKVQLDSELNWYKAKTDRSYKEQLVNEQ